MQQEPEDAHEEEEHAHEIQDAAFEGYEDDGAGDDAAESKRQCAVTKMSEFIHQCAVAKMKLQSFAHARCCASASACMYTLSRFEFSILNLCF